MSTDTTQCRSFSSRLNTLCGRTWHITYRSPAELPLSPASPSPRNRSEDSLSIPAGIFTVIFLFFCTVPFPLQSRHGLSSTSPLPLHARHVSIRTNCANPEELILCTWPLPPHSVQTRGVLP